MSNLWIKYMKAFCSVSLLFYLCQKKLDVSCFYFTWFSKKKYINLIHVSKFSICVYLTFGKCCDNFIDSRPTKKRFNFNIHVRLESRPQKHAVFHLLLIVVWPKHELAATQWPSFRRQFKTPIRHIKFL